MDVYEALTPDQWAEWREGIDTRGPVAVAEHFYVLGQMTERAKHAPIASHIIPEAARGQASGTYAFTAEPICPVHGVALVNGHCPQRAHRGRSEEVDMRDIKFRVWAKPWTRPDGTTWGGEMREVDLYWFEENMVSTVGDHEMRDYVLMQYIGRDDIHDRPIYEGDIVRYNDTYGHPCTYEIRWDAQGLRWDAPCIYDGRFRFLPMEVIGNVYEHAHLLAPAALH